MYNNLNSELLFILACGAKRMTFAPGAKLGPYEILAPIGAGGMGRVYRARDSQLGRDIAIKVLPQNVSGDEEWLARFENEAHLASSLNHPNIVTIYSMGWEGRSRYIAMEFIDGPTLQQLMERGPIPVGQALNISAQIADGLAKAHEAGIIHRDLKPKNVMLTKDGRVKILDFGLSKLTRSSVDSEAPTATPIVSAESLTRPGTILGTVDYMSPEQAAGRYLDFRSDQFSMGSLMYAILSGRRPFQGDSAVQTLAQIIEDEPRPVSKINPLVPPSYQAVIQRCMMKNPQDRYQSTGELAVDLRRLESAEQVRPQPLALRNWRRALIVLAILLAALGVFWIWNRQPYQPKSAARDWYEKGTGAMHSMTFETARRAFEQAVAADPDFALAHAGLAKAYDELDYSERAKEWMLRAATIAQEKRLSSADQERLRTLQCLVSRDYERAVPLMQQHENTASPQEKPAAALEVGWLAQQREDTAAAEAAYKRAIGMDPKYAAARLRLGYIQQRRGEDEAALKSFSEAETLYSAAGNYEGVTEALYQRANFLNRRGRAAEAMKFIDQAIAVARTVGNRYQEIRLQLLQSGAARKLGQNARARELAQQAIDVAVAGNMDNLATSGLIALGNSFLVADDLDSAEKYFLRALDIARRGKVQRYEAMASISLASVFEQKSRPEETKRYIEAALPFYSKAGYRRELAQCLTVLGGALNQLGEFDEAVRLLRDAVKIATQLQDLETERHAQERLTETLQDQGNWPEALRECEHTFSRTESTWNRLNCSGLYGRLGRRQEAERCLATVEQLLRNSDDRQLRCLFMLQKAELAYAGADFKVAKAIARMAISEAYTTREAEEAWAQLIGALASIRTSRGREGIQSAVSVIQGYGQARLAGDAASARLATAEALLAVGNYGLARTMVLQALDFFERRRIWESVWRGRIVAARASSDSAEIRTHLSAARSAFAQLRSLWPAADVDSYLQRTDIKLLSAGMPF